MKKIFVPILFFAAAFFCYPLLWNWSDLRYFAEAPLFGEAALALLALLLLTADTGRLNQFFRCDSAVTSRMLYAFIPGGIALLMHYYFFRGNNELLLRGMFWFAVPLLAAVYYREMIRPLLLFVAAAGILNLCFLVSARLDGAPPHGMTGNWNWSATLLILGISCGSIFFRNAKWLRWGLPVLAPVIAWAVFGTAFLSRGAICATLTAWLLLSLGLAPARYRKIAVAVAVAVAACAVVWLVRHPVETDAIRTALYRSTVQLIGAHPLGGVGPGRFSSEIAPLLGENYHRLHGAADISPHPHNEVLFWGATLGFGGIVLFLAYAVCGWAALRKLRTADWRGGNFNLLLVFYLFALLLLHGQIDVLLSNWPCDTIFLAAAGILWGYAADNGKQAPPIPEMEQSAVRWPLVTVRILLAAGLCVWLVRDFGAGYFARRAMIAAKEKNLRAAGENWALSRKFRATPRNLYGSALHMLYDRKDPEATLNYLRRLPQETLLEHHWRNHQLAGRALFVLGDYAGAAREWRQDLHNYPCDPETPELLKKIPGTAQKQK